MSDDYFVFYAPNLEDVRLLCALSAEVPGDGFYINVGASVLQCSLPHWLYMSAAGATFMSNRCPNRQPFAGPDRAT